MRARALRARAFSGCANGETVSPPFSLAFPPCIPDPPRARVRVFVAQKDAPLCREIGLGRERERERELFSKMRGRKEVDRRTRSNFERKQGGRNSRYNFDVDDAPVRLAKVAFVLSFRYGAASQS